MTDSARQNPILVRPSTPTEKVSMERLMDALRKTMIEEAEAPHIALNALRGLLAMATAAYISTYGTPAEDTVESVADSYRRNVVALLEDDLDDMEMMMNPKGLPS